MLEYFEPTKNGRWIQRTAGYKPVLAPDGLPSSTSLHSLLQQMGTVLPQASPLTVVTPELDSVRNPYQRDPTGVGRPARRNAWRRAMVVASNTFAAVKEKGDGIFDAYPAGYLRGKLGEYTGAADRLYMLGANLASARASNMTDWIEQWHAASDPMLDRLGTEWSLEHDDPVLWELLAADLDRRGDPRGPLCVGRVNGWMRTRNTTPPAPPSRRASPVDSRRREFEPYINAPPH